MMKGGIKGAFPYFSVGVSALNEKMGYCRKIDVDRHRRIQLVNYDMEGYNPYQHIKLPNLNAHAKKRAVYDYVNHTIIDDNLVLYYKKVISLCKERDIDLILMKYPLHRNYLIQSRKFIPDVEEHYDKVYEKIGIGEDQKIFDYQTIFPKEDHLFFNSDHMNIDGSILLSRKVRDDIVEYGIS
jgi:hypothetical protein